MFVCAILRATVILQFSSLYFLVYPSWSLCFGGVQNVIFFAMLLHFSFSRYCPFDTKYGHNLFILLFMVWNMGWKFFWESSSVIFSWVVYYPNVQLSRMSISVFCQYFSVHISLQVFISVLSPYGAFILCPYPFNCTYFDFFIQFFVFTFSMWIYDGWMLLLLFALDACSIV